MDDKMKGRNSKLINISYITSAVAYLIGWYLVSMDYLWAFIFAVPTLILGLNLIRNGERRYGLVLLVFFFVWIIIFWSSIPAHS